MLHVYFAAHQIIRENRWNSILYSLFSNFSSGWLQLNFALFGRLNSELLRLLLFSVSCWNHCTSVFQLINNRKLHLNKKAFFYIKPIIKINDTNIHHVSAINLLGLLINQHLNCFSHIEQMDDYLTKAPFKKLFSIQRIFLPQIAKVNKIFPFIEWSFLTAIIGINNNLA